MSTTELDEDGFTGEATVLVDKTQIPVEVRLRGHFQPIDGYYRWYGRIATNQRLCQLLAGRKRAATIRTPHGQAECQLSDPDPWDRYRVTGTSTPPFPVPTSLEDVET